MKKIIAGTLVASALLIAPTFADSEPLMKIMPISAGIVEDIKIDNADIILRNNNIESDYKYNSTHYFTSKIKAEDIVIPKEIKEKAEKIYFLVEEGNSRIYFGKSMLMDEAVETEEVKKEYNYKIVDFKESQDEYIFDNKDLVKDFSDDKYTSVNITLMAEMKDGKKVPVSNSAYISINDKKSVLSSLERENKDEDFYFGYYNRDDLETYLENMSAKMDRVDYKKMLLKADSKIKATIKKNEDSAKTILKSIKKESDFQKHIGKYKIYNETRSLLSNLGSAVNNQIQNIRAFDAIDKILNK